MLQDYWVPLLTGRKLLVVYGLFSVILVKGQVSFVLFPHVSEEVFLSFKTLGGIVILRSTFKVELLDEGAILFLFNLLFYHIFKKALPV